MRSEVVSPGFLNSMFLQSVQPQLRRTAMAFHPLACSLPCSGRCHGVNAFRLEPLISCNFHISANPQAARISPSRHGGQCVIGARAFIRVDHACQFTDKQRTKVPEFLRQARILKQARHLPFHRRRAATFRTARYRNTARWPPHLSRAGSQYRPIDLPSFRHRHAPPRARNARDREWRRCQPPP